MKVQAADGTVYDSTLIRREPWVSSIELQRGGFVVGWLTFEVPEELATKLTLLYSSGLQDPTISVSLPPPE